MKLHLQLAILLACMASIANAAPPIDLDPALDSPPLNLRQAQEMMANLGIYTGTVAGTMTAETRSALQQLQSLCGTPASGVLDTPTRECLVRKRLSFPEGLTPKFQNIACKAMGYKKADDVLCGPDIMLFPALPDDDAPANLRQAQRHLGAIGLYAGELQIADTDPNAATATALKQFQQANKLPTTGKLDRATGLLITQQMHAARGVLLSRPAFK